MFPSSSLRNIGYIDSNQNGEVSGVMGVSIHFLIHQFANGERIQILCATAGVSFKNGIILSEI